MRPEEVRARYRAYLDVCNRHALDELPAYLAGQITVNGVPKSSVQYVKDLEALFASFPDYRWTIARTVVEERWLAVHLRDAGTRAGAFRGGPGDGTRVATDEFAIYHFDLDGLIEHVEVTADNARLRT